MIAAGLSLSNKIAKMGKYESGYKYCRKCGFYFRTDAIRCPICRNILRASPRKKAKDKRIHNNAINPPPEILEESSNIKVIIKRQEN